MHMMSMCKAMCMPLTAHGHSASPYIGGIIHHGEKITPYISKKISLEYKYIVCLITHVLQLSALNLQQPCGYPSG